MNRFLSPLRGRGGEGSGRRADAGAGRVGASASDAYRDSADTAYDEGFGNPPGAWSVDVEDYFGATQQPNLQRWLIPDAYLKNSKHLVRASVDGNGVAKFSFPIRFHATTQVTQTGVSEDLTYSCYVYTNGRSIAVGTADEALGHANLFVPWCLREKTWRDERRSSRRVSEG